MTYVSLLELENLNSHPPSRHVSELKNSNEDTGKSYNNRKDTEDHRNVRVLVCVLGPWNQVHRGRQCSQEHANGLSCRLVTTRL